MPDPTPGEIAYEAHYAETDLARVHGLTPFDALPAWQQARWEQTALAVLTRHHPAQKQPLAAPPAPGAVAYAAFVAVTARLLPAPMPTFADLVPVLKRAWEAAAQAVLTAAGSAPGACP